MSRVTARRAGPRLTVPYGRAVAAFAALMSSVLWGSADFFGGLISRRMPAFVVVAASQLVALLFVAPIAWLTGGFDVAAGAYLWWGAAAGIVGALALGSFYYALSIGTMGVVSPLSAMGIVVPVIVGLVIGERPAPVQLVGIAIITVAVVLVGGPDVRTDEEDDPHGHGPRSVVFALLAALGFGLALVFLGLGGQQDWLMTVVAQRTASTALIGLPVLAVMGRKVLRRRDWPALGGVGLGDVSANATYAWSTSVGLLSITAVFASLFPVATVLLARFVLHERLSRLQSIGVVAAVVGIVMIGAGS
jgi:drug/metabolite transporter (DMT)-like permease